MSRAARTDKAKKQLRNLEGRKKHFETELAKLEVQIKAKKSEVDALEKFTSDAEEFAHFLGEVVQSGGDPQKIMSMLEDRGMMNKFDMADMHRPKAKPKVKGESAQRFQKIDVGK